MFTKRDLKKIVKDIETTSITKESVRPFAIVDGIEQYLSRRHKGQFTTTCCGLDEGICRVAPMRIAKFMVYLFDSGVEMLHLRFHTEDDIFFITIDGISLDDSIPNEFLMEAELSGFYIRQKEDGIVLSMPIQTERFRALLLSVEKLNFGSILEGAREMLDELEKKS